MQATRSPRLLAAIAMLAALVPTSLGAQEASDYEEGFFELFTQELTQRRSLITLVDSEQNVLIPLDAVLDHLGIPVSQQGDSLFLEWPPVSWRTVLDAERGTVETAGELQNWGQSHWIEQDGITYGSPEMLSAILSAEIEVIWEDLMITITGNRDFPAIVRLRQEARRARATQQAMLYDPFRFEGVPYPSRTGGFAAGWSTSLSETDGMTEATIRPTLGASLLGGGAEIGVTGFFRDAAGVDASDFFARYTRVISGVDWIRKVEAGSILGEGMVLRRLIGASVTNHPYTIPRYFDEALISPAVPAGWEYEVYQGEQLVGMWSADDPTSVRAPTNYGNTPVTIRMLGPAGQERVEELVYVVPADRVPTGDWRYTAGGGRCEDAGCDDYFFGEVVHGVRSWLTTGVGAERISLGSMTKFRPFGRLSVSPAPYISASLQTQGSSFWRLDTRYDGGRKGVVRTAYSWSAASPTALGLAGWSGQFGASGPVGLLGGRWLHARAIIRGVEQDRADSWQASVSTMMAQTLLSIGVESGLQPGTLATARAVHTMVGDLPGSLRDASLETAVGVGPGGVDLFEIGGAVRTSPRALLDTNFRFRRGLPAVFTVGMTIRSGVGLFRARGARGSSTGVYLGADGGLAYSGDTGLLPLTYGSVGRSGVAGDVFYDLDGDLTWDEGEEPVEGARVWIDGSPAITAADGSFQAWQVDPYEGVSIALDSMSVDPEWAPAESEVLMKPSPNLFNRVSVPLHRTAELLGSVQTSDSIPHPLGGVAVEIVDQDTNVVVATERTFSDGVFYVRRVRHGRYAARIAAPSLAALGAGASPELLFEVAPDADPFLELPPLLLGP